MWVLQQNTVPTTTACLPRKVSIVQNVSVPKTKHASDAIRSIFMHTKSEYSGYSELVTIHGKLLHAKTHETYLHYECGLRIHNSAVNNASSFKRKGCRCDKYALRDVCIGSIITIRFFYNNYQVHYLLSSWFPWVLYVWRVLSYG